MNSPYYMIRVCMTCTKVLGTKVATDAAMHGQTTHGICEVCYADMLRELNAVPVVTEEVAA